MDFGILVGNCDILTNLEILPIDKIFLCGKLGQ